MNSNAAGWGGGCQSSSDTKKDPTIERDLLKLVESGTGGDPERHRQYVRSVYDLLAQRLGRGSASTIRRLLKPLGYSLKTNVKRLIGKPRPQRDQQCRFIQRCNALFVHHDQPVISVDAKKSELIGAFKNNGAHYFRTADEVNTDDFPSDAIAKAVPYGIYNAQSNRASFVQSNQWYLGWASLAVARHRTCFDPRDDKE